MARETGTFAEPELPMKGRLINLAYDGQGNRKSLHVDGQLSHNYTPGPANEYTAVSYSNAVGMIAGMAEHPGRVVVGNELAERQGQYFYRDYSAGSAASWTMQKVFAAAEPPAGNYVQQYTTAQKEMYLPPASHTPSYDAAGNLLSDGWWTYEYDGENRLIRQASVAYHPDGRSRELLFNYDYLGRRVNKTVKAYSYDEETLSTTAFVYWDWHLIAELNVAWNGAVSRKRHYVWGLDKEGVRPGAGGVGGLLMVADNVTNKTYLAMNDYIGNVVGLIDSSDGSVAAAYEYDPFGRPIRETGTYAAQNPIRFSSQYTDQETGLVYFGFRYYHPQWGRFLNRDPIEELGGGNLYRFVSNDPVNRWDLLGLSEGSGNSRSYQTIDEWRRSETVRMGPYVSETPQQDYSEVQRLSDGSGSSGESGSSDSGSTSQEPSAGQAQVEQKQEQVRSGFATIHEAGIAASMEALQRTSSDRRHEYGGELYSYDDDGVKKYGYTEPRRGGDREIINGETHIPGPKIDSRMIPNGATFVGGYHSHPSSMSFSYLDRKAVRETGLPLYVGRSRSRNGNGAVVEVLIPTEQVKPPSEKHRRGIWKMQFLELYNSRNHE